MTRKHKTGPRSVCSGLFGPPLNVAYSEDDKPHVPAYLPAATSQTFNSPGALAMDPPAEANSRPSGLNATDLTASVPLRVARSLPVAASQSLTVLSWLAEARVLPSGLNATDITS